MSEWMQGFTSGLVGTIIGFSLTMLWDLWKGRREDARRDDAVMHAVFEELGSVSTTLAANKIHVDADVRELQSRRTYISPLRLLENSAWDLVKLNMPKKLAAAPGNLSKVRAIASNIILYNETVRSRERYRTGNTAMGNFAQMLMAYDEALLKQTSFLANLVTEAMSLLEGDGPKKVGPSKGDNV